MLIKVITYDQHVKEILTECQLDQSDIEKTTHITLLGYYTEEILIGTVALEIYNHHALLRSLAVTKTKQGHGVGHALVKAAEAYALTHNIQQLYLLTITAATFFEQLGYIKLPRTEHQKPLRLPVNLLLYAPLLRLLCIVYSHTLNVCCNEKEL